MSSLINGLLDIEQNTCCCTKKAIKMNIRHHSGRPLSPLNYYFLFIYYYLISFTLLYIFIHSYVLPYTILYFTIQYFPLWCIVYVSNTITLFIIIKSLMMLKKFVKDVMCECPEIIYTN
jgi:hypothetical protein